MSFAAAFLSVLLTTLPSGRQVLPKPILSLGGAAHVASVAEDVEDVAERTGVARERIAALLIGENSNLDPDAASKGGSSVGLMMLNRGTPKRPGPYYVAWRNACAAVPSACRWANLIVGAQALKEALRLARSRYASDHFAHAVAIYRGGWRRGHPLEPRRHDWRVVDMAKWIAGEICDV